MPTFKDVVNFLNNSADVANHPFFSSSSTAKKKTSRKSNADDLTTSRKFTTLAIGGAKEDNENFNP